MKNKRIIHRLCINDLFSGRDLNREKARLRDNHKCQRCGKKWKIGTRRFDIHHLKGLCGKKSRGYDKGISYLITYCHACHLSLHSVRSKMRKAYRKRTFGLEMVKRRSLVVQLRTKGWMYKDIAKILKIRTQGVFIIYKRAMARKYFLA